LQAWQPPGPVAKFAKKPLTERLDDAELAIAA
jgi:hypothetical protein